MGQNKYQKSILEEKRDKMKSPTSFRLDPNVKIMLAELAKHESRPATNALEYLIKESYKLTFGIDAYLKLITK